MNKPDAKDEQTAAPSDCPYCHGTGYDASGLVCTCQPDPFPWWKWLENYFASLFRRKGKSE